MRLLSMFLEFFIHAFQITRPRPEQQRRAEVILGGLTLAVLLLVAALVVGMLVWAFRA